MAYFTSTMFDEFGVIEAPSKDAAIKIYLGADYELTPCGFETEAAWFDEFSVYSLEELIEEFGDDSIAVLNMRNAIELMRAQTAYNLAAPRDAKLREPGAFFPSRLECDD